MRIATAFFGLAATFVVASSFLSVSVVAFQSPSMSFYTTRATQTFRSKQNVGTQLHETKNSEFQIELDMPPSGSGVQARLKFGSVLSVPSEIVEVRYKLPFGLDVAPMKNLAVCTKDGAGGEKAGDVLRYTSQWVMGLPSDNLAATAAFTGIGPTWQCTMFDIMKAKNWEKVVEALTSNVDSRTDEVVLIFERPLEPAPELQG